MADYEQLMEGARRADAAGDGVAVKRFLELAAEAQRGGGQQAPATTGAQAGVLPMGTPEAAAANRQSLLYGALKPINEAASLLGRGMEAAAPFVGAQDWAKRQRESIEQANRQITAIGRENIAKAPLGKSSEFIGSMLGMAPVLGRLPARIAGSAIAGGAVAGATGAALTPVDEKSPSYWTEKAKQVALGGATGGAIGGLTSKIGSMLAPVQPPLSEAVKKQATAAYNTAEQAGLVIKNTSFARAVGDIKDTIAKEGVDETLHPRVLAAFQRLEKAAKNHQSLEGIDILRRVVKNAASSNDASERRIAGIMIDKLDDYTAGLQPADILGGASAEAATKALREARSLWSRAKKSEFVEDLIERAANRAGQFTGSGYENALRTEFRNVVQSPRRMRTFTKEEQASLRAVARGGPIGNAMRWLGKLAPRGIVSTTLGAGLGYGVAGGPGAIAVPVIGELGRAAATASTSRRAQQALQTMLRVGPAVPQVNPLDALLPYAPGIMGQQAAGFMGR